MHIPAVLCPNFSKNYRVVLSYPYLCLCFLVLRLEKYANMFDLLGQVGNLEDAKRTIEQMLNIHLDAHIWQIFLSACNIQENVVLGNVAARKLVELQSEN